MKFTCTQENFNRGLLITSHIANRNTALPILNNVLIKASGGLITLTTTNLEIGISVKVRGKIEKEGEFTVQAKLISDYIGLLPRENINLELEEQTLRLSCGSYKTSIKGLNSSDFPVIPEIERYEPIILKSRDLKNSLAQVMFAVAIDETRPEISGVLFSFSDKTLTIAGTDSYRLSEKKIILISTGTGDKQLIIPLRTLQEVYRILSDSEETEVSLFINDSQILFKINDEVELTSRLVEGQYPDYQQIIPRESRTQVKIKVNELVRVIKSAALFCKPGINDVKLTFLAKKNELVVSSINSAIGENLVTLEADCAGEDNEVVFNYRYLLDGLNNLAGDEAMFGLVSSSAPGMIRPAGDDSYLYIIMPIRQ